MLMTCRGSCSLRASRPVRRPPGVFSLVTPSGTVRRVIHVPSQSPRAPFSVGKWTPPVRLVQSTSEQVRLGEEP